MYDLGRSRGIGYVYKRQVGEFEDVTGQMLQARIRLEVDDPRSRSGVVGDEVAGGLQALGCLTALSPAHVFRRTAFVVRHSHVGAAQPRPLLLLTHICLCLRTALSYLLLSLISRCLRY